MPLLKSEPEPQYSLILGVRRIKSGAAHGLFELVKFDPADPTAPPKQLVDADTQALITKHMHMELMRI